MISVWSALCQDVSAGSDLSACP